MVPRSDELLAGVQAPEQAEARDERTQSGRFAKGASTAQRKGGKALKNRTALSHVAGLKGVLALPEFRPYLRQAKDHQVLYTTHSPFMVPTKRFDRVRIVEDKSMETTEDLPRGQAGTKVVSDVLRASKGTLFPLQGALGYDLAQSLFIGPHSLIVEGVSDLLYLQVLSALLKAAGRTALDERWTITPVGGADKVPAFAALFSPQSGLQVATLIDFARKSEQTIQNLYKEQILEQSHVLTYAHFTKTKEADIEDMFDPAFYVDLVNAEYSKELSKRLIEASLPIPSGRILKRLEEALKQSGSTVQLNHYRPARKLAETMGLQSALSQVTLDRFEEAFKTLNALLT